MKPQTAIFLSISSSVLFGALFYMSTLLWPLTGTGIFGWRMVTVLPVLTLLLIFADEWHHAVSIWNRARKDFRLVVGLVLSSALLGVQQWLFLWAPINGSAMQASLGYFLLPLTMVCVGRFAYHEKLNGVQMAAVATAFVGVVFNLLKVGSLSWETGLVALGFPAYFVLRKTLRTNNLGGLWFDIALMMPVAVLFLFENQDPVTLFANAPKLFVLIPVVAVMTAAAFIFYVVASRNLSFGIFGLLGYVEPVLLFVVSIAVGASVQKAELATYIPIFISIALLAFDGLRHFRRDEPIQPVQPVQTDLVEEVINPSHLREAA